MCLGGGSLVTKLSWTLSNLMDGSLEAPPSMAFSRQEYWSGHFLLSGNLPDPEVELVSPALQADDMLSH